jgi:FKBP-type peptidyl-prolyl cis-trans isomerase
MKSEGLSSDNGTTISMIIRNIFLIGFLAFSCTVGKTSDGQYYTSTSGLQYRTLQEGSGPEAGEGNEVLIFETTTYRDGTVLYSNMDTDSPVKIKIGANQATLAVDEGLRGMKIGEIRELVAPPHLVRRTSYPPNVSPDSSLVIRILLHKIL